MSIVVAIIDRAWFSRHLTLCNLWVTAKSTPNSSYLPGKAIFLSYDTKLVNFNLTGKPELRTRRLSCSLIYIKNILQFFPHDIKYRRCKTMGWPVKPGDLVSKFTSSCLNRPGACIRIQRDRCFSGMNFWYIADRLHDQGSSKSLPWRS